MDYKNTLNLPRTGFPMKADLVTREPERLKQWEASGLYAKIQAARAGAEKFVLHDGPPFANGDVHVGTALNKILKDIIVKYKTLRGFSAPYIPGWDCHGLPIEFKVSQEMRKRAADVSSAGPADSSAGKMRQHRGPPGLRSLRRKYIDLQRTQFKRLGVLGDWDNPYLTLNKEYEADELRLFADIVAQGFVYRGKKPVYWSIPCRTALAEAEVEYQDHVSPSVYVKFPVVGQPNTFVLIWTTTPWTLPANLAVAYNSTFQYVKVVARASRPCVSEKDNPASATETHGRTPVPLPTAKRITFCSAACWPLSRKNAAGADMPNNHFRRNSLPNCNTSIRLQSHQPALRRRRLCDERHRHWLCSHRAGARSGRLRPWPKRRSADLLAVDDDGRFAHTNDLPIEQQMPAEMLGKSILEKHGKSDANEAVLHELRARKALCTKKITTTATRIAGAAKRPSSSARWTSGLSRLTMFRGARASRLHRSASRRTNPEAKFNARRVERPARGRRSQYFPPTRPSRD